MKSLREQNSSGDLTKRQLHRLGSTEVGLRKVVNEFHEALQTDEKLEPIFAKVDLAGCSTEQAHFLELALADDTEAESKAWHKKHLGMLKEKGLTPELFERYQQVFKTTMQDLQLPEARIQSAMKFMQGAW